MDAFRAIQTNFFREYQPTILEEIQGTNLRDQVK